MSKVDSQQRVLSGMRPTGRLHLGHLHGVLNNWVKLQHEYECFFFVADWHALTTHYDDSVSLEQNVIDMVIDWLAVGVNPGSAALFVQSRVPEHAELHLLLSMITPPVCLATIAAASVAGTNFWQTGWAGVRLGFVAYIVPFLFVFYPELVFEGSAGAIIAVMVKSTIGVVILCYCVAGFMYDRLGAVERLILGVAGLAVLAAPYDSGVGLGIIAAALAVTAIMFTRGRARRGAE